MRTELLACIMTITSKKNTPTKQVVNPQFDEEEIPLGTPLDKITDKETRNMSKEDSYEDYIEEEEYDGYSIEENVDEGMDPDSDNPFTQQWINGASKEMHHERNDECTTHNVIIITDNRWQKDKSPTEEMARSSFPEFKKLNPKFIEYEKFSEEEVMQHYWEFKLCMFKTAHANGTNKFITWHAQQLSADLKEENPRRTDFPNNWRNVLDWHKSVEGGTKDKIAWQNRQAPCDNKKIMKEVAEQFRIHLGIGCKHRNKQGWIETTNKYSKRIMQKSTQDKRKSSHGKLLNSTTTNNQVSKKLKPGEMTTWKRKPGTFHADRFVYFEGEDGAGNFNYWLMSNGGKEKDKVPVEIVPSSKKPKPSIKMK